MIVAVHQPNYFPWLGFFRKMAKADYFIFLDDVQFSKGSYTNRVEIRAEVTRRWLTVPIRVSLGQSINEVFVAKEDWVSGHLRILKQSYSRCPYFEQVWPDIQGAYSVLTSNKLSEININLIMQIADHLNLKIETCLASAFSASGKSDDRLISLLEKVSPGCVYLSGEGGDKYQSVEKFRIKGFDVQYSAFKHPVYSQHPPETPFEVGLSILDAIFNLGWERTASLITPVNVE